MSIRNRPRHVGRVVVTLLVLLGPGCGDDSPANQTPDGEASSSGSTSSNTLTLSTLDPSLDSTESMSGGSGSTSEDTTAGEDTTTGGALPGPGQTNTQLVTSGTRTASNNYSAVFTIGQPSQLQHTHTSANYRVQGGLVGANGSPP